MRLFRIHITDGDTSTEAVVRAENAFMAARYAVLFGDEIIYLVTEV